MSLNWYSMVAKEVNAMNKIMRNRLLKHFYFSHY